MDKFIIVDGNSLANRAYYAMPYLSNKFKQPSGAVFGFANLIVKLILEQRPKYFAVAFDHARKTFRNDIYADYKGTRKETPQDLRDQFPVIKQMLEKMGIKIFEFASLEADDIIGTLAKNSSTQNILVSGDKDLLQLINANTTVWLTRKGVTEIEVFDKSHLFEKYAIEPKEVIDLKALMGDSSDNIPGVPGIGEKTALNLLGKYEGLDGVYNHIDEIKGMVQEKLIVGKDSAYISQKLATIKTDCKIEFLLEDCKCKFPFSQEVYNFFERWDFRSLINKKDIFQENVAPASKNYKIIELDSIQKVKELVDNTDSVFCYDFENLKFYIGGDQIFSLKKEADLFSQCLDFNEVLNCFKNIFENEKIVKITNSSKEDIKILNKYNIKLVNFFDLEIAKYVLFAGLPKQPIIELADFITARENLLKQMQDTGVYYVYENIEIPLVQVLVDMEVEGFKVDEKTLNELNEKYTAELETLTRKIYQLAGEEFNINSPKQVAYILFDKLHLKSFNNKKLSTSFAVLDDIRWQNEIVDYIIAYRKTSKLLSTYINVYKSICQRDGAVIRTMFNQTLTSTGRLSSYEPNMQNIPTRNEEGRSLRKIFISKYQDGQIVSADYSQIELRLLANLAKEESMIEAYNQGVDIHTKTASEIFKVPITEVTSAQRQDAKAVNFGIIYGISDYGLSQNIKTSRNNAKQYIENYFNKYPKIKKFMDQNIEFAKENGYVKSYFGRIRHIPEIASSNALIRKFGERVAMNMPLQGTASDIIKLAMIDFYKKIKQKHMQSHLILQIHDELIVDSIKDEVEIVKSLLKEAMEGVYKFEVPLTVEISSGKNLFEC